MFKNTLVFTLVSVVTSVYLKLQRNKFRRKEEHTVYEVPVDSCRRRSWTSFSR
jgi:hypothetical protein